MELLYSKLLEIAMVVKGCDAAVKVWADNDGVEPWNIYSEPDCRN